MNFSESHSKDLINTSNLEIREYVFTCATSASKKKYCKGVWDALLGP